MKFADTVVATFPFTMSTPKYLAFEGIGILDDLVLRKERSSVARWRRPERRGAATARDLRLASSLGEPAPPRAVRRA